MVSTSSMAASSSAASSSVIWGIFHVAVFGQLDAQFGFQREQGRHGQHIPGHGLAEGAQHYPPAHVAGPVHQHLVIGIAGGQDDHIAVVPLAEPVVHLQQDGGVAAVFAGHSARRVVQGDAGLGKSGAVIGTQAPVAESLAAQHAAEYLPHVSHRFVQGLRRNGMLVKLRPAADVFPVDSQ